MSTCRATVTDTHWLTPNTLCVTLEPETYIPYEAGQYLAILVEGNPVYFSIANAPNLKNYQLHIRIHPTHETITALLTLLQTPNTVHLLPPQGQCHLKALSSDPIIFIAGGTGIAPIIAMIETLITTKDTREFSLYWGVKTKADAYFNDALIAWQKQKSFDYFCYDEAPSLLPLMKQLTTQHAHLWTNKNIVIQGPFKMVFSLTKYLLNAGVKRHNLFSDAFEFSNGA